MRHVALLLLLTALSLSAFAAKHVTVKQLEQVLVASHANPDAKVASQLFEMELTERLDPTTLARWEAEAPGPETRQALLALADMSAFLNLPAAEIPSTTAPDFNAQRRLMAMTVDYVSKTISNLPNFFATRVTTHFEDTPQGFEKAQTGVIPAQPLHFAGNSSANVVYRDGAEVLEATVGKGNKSAPAAQGLTTSGEFGPILVTTLLDAAHAKLAWSHWEQGAHGPEAVFGYVVPKEKSHYQVEFCCVQGNGRNSVFRQLSGYHGEMAVDPESGAILRLTLQADLKPSDPILKADIMVEYGPVEIGGKTYICPVKSVSNALAKPQVPASILMQGFQTQASAQYTPNVPGHQQTLLNDVAFVQYHVFRADARVMAGNDGQTSGKPPVHGPSNPALSNTSSAETGNIARPAASAKPAENASAAAPTGIPPATVPSTTSSSPVAASSAVERALAPAPTSGAESAAPEIRVAETTSLPEIPAIPLPASPESSSPLRTTARLVDVGVVATEKNGNPVTNLKPEDFEIYDNGRKQSIRFFSLAGEVEVSAGPSGQPVFSNRRPAPVDATPEVGGTEGSVTILLIDPRGLAWADLTYAREQIARFLRGLPAKERVGLYVLQGNGFQVLEEGTAAHGVLGAKLTQWMPNAQDLARAQEEERRNALQMNTARSPADVQAVNGNGGGDLASAALVDPDLHQIGGDSRGNASSILVSVARHLAAVPGRKNLVWITSNDVLAGRNDNAARIQKGSGGVDEFARRAEEAMNDAHVAIYPLDASQLEPGGINPEVETHIAELQQGSNLPLPSNIGPGRSTAEMQNAFYPIQGAARELADATGGRVIRRNESFVASLNGVVEDGRAGYLLSFTPDSPADDQYHLLTVKLTTRRGVMLRYRAGYQNTREPTTLKDRFRQAIWQPVDVNEIAVSANPVAASTGATLKLNIAANDLAIKQHGEHWVDQLDIFLVQRNNEDLHARITGHTLKLALKPETYKKVLWDGVAFDQPVERTQETGFVRVVVVDENSGRMGSVTIPAAVFQAKR
jgi:VWFA-related protein